MEKENAKKLKREAEMQFKDELLSISVGLQAGMSMEKAIQAATGTMAAMHGPWAVSVKHLESITNSLKCNETIENAFAKLAEETDIDAVRDFAGVLVTAKRTGGNIVAVIDHTAGCLEMREEVKRDVETMLAGKKYEALLMNIMPLGILVYLKLGLPDISEALYGNFTGVIIMTVALSLYIASVLWTEKLLGEVS